MNGGATVIARATPGPPSDPAWLVPLAAASSALNFVAAAIAAATLALITAYVIIEIGLRVFSLSTYMLDTVAGHGVAAVTFLAMPWALEKGAMIRVGYFLKTGSARLRWSLEMWSTLSALAFMTFIARYQWETVVKDFVRGTTSQHYLPVPNWISASIFLYGVVLTVVFLLVRLLRQLAVGTPADNSMTDLVD